MFGRLTYKDSENLSRSISVCDRDSLKITDKLESEYKRLSLSGASSGAIYVVAVIDGESETVINRKHIQGYGWVDYDSFAYRQLECV